MNNKGQFLLITLCILGILLFAAIPLSQNIILGIKNQKVFMNKDKAYFLARAGINKVNWRIKNEGWEGANYSLNFNNNEIKNILSSGNGSIDFLGEGGFKYIKIIGKDEIYVMGFCGKDVNSASSKVFIRQVNGKWRIF